MDDELSEERIGELVKHGEKNIRTAKLVKNWCGHAQINRSPGRGLIEEIYQVPIGHSGVGCQHAPAGGLMCWDLEEAFLNHYLKNCKTCTKRAPGVGADMQAKIDAFEAKRKEKEAEQAAREKAEAEALAQRRKQRAQVFDNSNPTEVEICELIDCIDNDGDKDAKRKLLELSRIAPDAFSAEIIDYFVALTKAIHSPLRSIAADIIITVSGHENQKLEAALVACDYGLSDIVANCIRANADSIPKKNINEIIGPLAYRAATFRSIGSHSRPADPAPLLAITKAHPDEISNTLVRLLDKNNNHDVDVAACIISRIASQNPNLTKPIQRQLLAKLLRRRHLLPDLTDRGMDEGLYRLRKAAIALFESDPDACEAILESLCQGAGKTSHHEREKIYAGVLRTSWNGPPLEPTPARKLAFKKLLWLAVDKVAEPQFDEAAHFFRQADKALLGVARNELDSLFGAAAMLSKADKDLEAKKAIDTPKTGLDLLELRSARNAIDSLQGGLIQWVFMISRDEGVQGVKRILELFENTPKTEVQFRANIIAHLTELIVDAQTMNCVLPYLYTAMTDNEALVRGSAATAIGEARYEIRRDFPDLIFEVYLALLRDPNVYVHRSAVRALKVYSFPENLKPALKAALFNLINAYYHETDQSEFLAVCLDEFSNGFLTDSDIEGNWGRVIVHVLSSMPDYSACKAVERMPLSMGNAPGYATVVAKLLSSAWGRDLMRNKLYRALFHTPREVLTDCTALIVEAAKVVATHNPYQIRIPIALLSRAGANEEVMRLCESILERLPDTREQKAVRTFLESLRLIAKFETTLPKSQTELKRACKDWDEHIETLERAKELDDAESSLPPIFFN